MAAAPIVDQESEFRDIFRHDPNQNLQPVRQSGFALLIRPLVVMAPATVHRPANRRLNRSGLRPGEFDAPGWRHRLAPSGRPAPD